MLIGKQLNILFMRKENNYASNAYMYDSRWLQDEDYMKNFGAMIGSFTGFIIGLAVVPTTTTKIKYYIDDNKLYYVGEDGI